ncbi:hypothetical protein KKC87_03920 [Patescibacteria group bacterium]|nr:hypothetical protein [Patescibacteria group bacterium]
MFLQEILQNLNIGLGVAEQETDKLAAYFVQTNQWKRILRGDIDVVYGPKGSGKSALYTLLIMTPPADPNTVFISAVDPRGTPAFKNVENDPPTSETEFQGLWKLYFAALIGNYFESLPAPKTNSATQLINSLKSEGLINKNKGAIFTRIISLLSRLRPGAKISVDPGSGAVSVEGRITLAETTTSETREGKISVNEIIESANAALIETQKIVWIGIDRLDVAFIDNAILEENALRALFHAYLDLMRFDNIKLKIFLRTDIWRRLTANHSFPEASHIVRQSTIEWSEEQLLNLIMHRLLNRPVAF